MRGSVYQRKSDKKWVGCVDLTNTQYADPSKKRDRKMVYADTEKEAQKKLNNLIYEIQNGLYIAKSKDTLVDFLKDYVKLNASTWAETTMPLYKMYIDVHIAPYFGKKPLSDIKPLDLDKFYLYKIETPNAKGKTLSPNTVVKLHKFLNAAFNYGVKKDIIRENICKKATPPKTEQYKPNVYSEQQFFMLWDYVKDKYDRVPIALGAGLGLRRGEIFGLTWKDIDFKNNLITIKETRVRFDKTITKKPKNEASERIVHAPQYVMDTLKGYKNEQKVINMENRILSVTPSYYSERFRWLLNKFDLPKTRLHDLRHYNATMMLKYGVPDKVASERLGHSDTTMLKKVYQHVLTDMDKSASEKLDEIFNKKKM